jgi:CheY-like chemotaxis protein
LRYGKSGKKQFEINVHVKMISGKNFKMKNWEVREPENCTEVMLFQNILHIDDDADDHEIFYSALRKISNAVHYVGLTSSKQALARLIAKELTPDVIFLDLNIPEMSGQQFLVEIKKYDDLRRIPVIILSTSSHPATIELTKELGASDFITKPHSFDKLVQILSLVLA